MNSHYPKQYYLTVDSACIITVTRKMVRVRAAELALVIGHSLHEVSKTEWEQAKRELLGAPQTAPEEAVTGSAADSEGWGTIPSSTGHHVTVPSGDEEDAEGRSDVERLVEDGVREAGREQRQAADQAAENNE